MEVYLQSLVKWVASLFEYSVGRRLCPVDILIVRANPLKTFELEQNERTSHTMTASMGEMTERGMIGISSARHRTGCRPTQYPYKGV